MSYAVREYENEWIPLADGTRLAARIWRPDDGGAGKFPAILEYIPYRKRDATAERDAQTHPYFAAHGYACLRVDMRGSGESDGVLDDEYLPLEQEDGLEVIAWIAAQPWCSGAVGMIGISWGGFNGLQIAARRPPALQAVVTVAFTDDRYADDVHFMGGCLLNDNLAWSATMLGYMARPPDPSLVGEEWRAIWLERLRQQPFLAEIWLRHQRRDAYWKHGSVCEDFGAITCPVLAVGGWADGYSNTVARLLEGLQVPRLGIVGPWAHRYPFFAKPGPQIGFLQECLRWFDQHLAGRATGVMDEPMYRVWMQDWQEPQAEYEQRAGRWVAEPIWPSPAIAMRRLFLTGAGLRADPGAEQRLDWLSPQDTGGVGGTWFSYGTLPDQPSDQRIDDARSLVFDTEPLAEAFEMLGAAALELDLAVDRPQAMLCIRLCDLSPEGHSLRVSYGVLNLTHRDGHETPEAMEPGRRYRIRLQLNDAAHRFAAGHRLRIAISTAYWPIIWPSPEPVTVSLFAGTSLLALPERTPRAEDAAIAFEPPDSAPPLPRLWHRPPEAWRRTTRDPATGERTVEVHTDAGRSTFPDIALDFESRRRETYRIHPADPLSATAEISVTWMIGRGSWRTRTETRSVMRATKTLFVLEAQLDAYEGDTPVLSRRWNAEIPRDGL